MTAWTLECEDHDQRGPRLERFAAGNALGFVGRPESDRPLVRGMADWLGFLAEHEHCDLRLVRD